MTQKDTAQYHDAPARPSVLLRIIAPMLLSGGRAGPETPIVTVPTGRNADGAALAGFEVAQHCFDAVPDMARLCRRSMPHLIAPEKAIGKVRVGPVNWAAAVA